MEERRTDEQKKKAVARLADACNAAPCRFFLLALLLTLFSWPYMSFIGRVSIEYLFGYLFAVWAVLIGVLMATNRAKNNPEADKNNG